MFWTVEKRTVVTKIQGKKDMGKEKVEWEYPLKSTSVSVLWEAIGTPYGLAEWFADKVVETGTTYVFTWGGYDETAVLQEVKFQEYIRFQWDYDAGSDCYFEMRMVRHELSGELTLLVTLFVEPDEQEDEKRLWNKHVDDLRRKIGI